MHFCSCSSFQLQRFEAAALVPGRVYRFVVAALNAVGEGNATAAFAAKMHCTPRTLAGAPAKVSGAARLESSKPSLKP